MKDKINVSVFDTRSLTSTIGFASDNFLVEQALESWTFSGMPYGILHDSWENYRINFPAIGGSNHNAGSVVFCALNFLSSLCFCFFLH